MNKKQRTKLTNLVKQIEELKGKAADLQSEVESQADEERGKFDNMTEGLQNGEKGQVIDAAATKLEEAKDAIESAVSSLEEAVDAINESMEG